MDSAPPGPVYLAYRVPALLVPLCALYVANDIAERAYGLRVSGWLLTLLYVVAIPIYVIVSSRVNEYLDNRAAAAVGAVVPTKLAHRWPLGLDIIKDNITSFKENLPSDNLLRYTEEYGNTFNFRILGENRVVTIEPEHIKALLATEFNNFEKGPVIKRQLKSVLGSGVFSSDGEMWKFHRSMTRPFFTKDRISHFDIFERHAEDAIDQMKARFKEGFAVDFQDLIARFTLDSATEFLFGHDVHSLSAGLPYPESAVEAKYANEANLKHPSTAFVKAFADAQAKLAMRGRFGSAWPLTEFWEDSAKKCMGPINAFIEPILQDALERKNNDKAGAEAEGADREVKDGETLLDHLVHCTEDQTILKDEILNMLVAGRDTTAGTLTFMVYMLSQHPDILRRLREEILTKVGPSRRPNYDDVREMKYLRAVINETLRLFPIVPLNGRTAINPTVWPSKRSDGKPYYIPAGTRVQYSVMLMHRRTDLWGPDALQFDPDRFIDERLHKYLTPNPFIFLPFNAGPRICLGQQFAYNEMSFMTVRLLQHFSGISLAPDAQPESSKPPASWATGEGRKPAEKIRPAQHLTLYATDGLWVRMTEASDDSTA
ncbi:cytochrome P450 [Gloeophyllum trabeum ATCC 11539]|uniref:Cytochrome P450 n=1 Tax=Gloeophyllum trabeum (strain ATCC 11539 / FP-39264 / Madison 617) TaxID=670483 RepID=S7Q8V1_GLOTA|nr:cytochrome P450 [Gloeophyllum trabeum ATCC 11539]EPQ55858.1 cytochrome P450 [Gloeophyllum trabeum ATCC 11539]